MKLIIILVIHFLGFIVALKMHDKEIRNDDSPSSCILECFEWEIYLIIELGIKCCLFIDEYYWGKS